MRNILIDAILFALFTAELCFHHLPKLLHEVLGVAMAAAIILHVAINWRRFTSLLRNVTPQKFFNAEIDLALTICAALILIPGAVMSNYLFADWVSFELRRNMTLHQLHVAAPYAMMILIGVHVGFHWRELRQRLLNTFGLEEFYSRLESLFVTAAVNRNVANYQREHYHAQNLV